MEMEEEGIWVLEGGRTAQGISTGCKGSRMMRGVGMIINDVGVLRVGGRAGLPGVEAIFIIVVEPGMEFGVLRRWALQGASEDTGDGV